MDIRWTIYELICTPPWSTGTVRVPCGLSYSTWQYVVVCTTIVQPFTTLTKNQDKTKTTEKKSQNTPYTLWEKWPKKEKSPNRVQITQDNTQ